MRPTALIPAVALAALVAVTACAPPPPPDGGGPTTTGGSSQTTVATTPPVTVPGPPKLYDVTPLDGWGQDGTVYSVAVAGDTVYAGGDFKDATHGGQSVARSNVMAVSRSTGDLLPGFVADANGIVHAVASDGTSVYVGGEFTTINGVAKSRLAKVDAATGAVDTTFTANAPDFVSDLLIVGSRLYVVGEFGSINGTTRRGAALVDKATGAVDATFNPDADLRVNTVALSPSGAKMYIAGVFASVGGTARSWLAEIDPRTGKVQGPSFPSIPDYVRDVTVGPDGMVFAAVGGKFNSAVGLDPITGKQRWRQHADGDVQAVKYSNGYVYFGFHDGFGGDPTKRLLAANPATGVLNPAFAPESGAYPGVLTIDADGEYLVVGGLFHRMGGRATVNGLSIHA